MHVIMWREKVCRESLHVLVKREHIISIPYPLDKTPRLLKVSAG